MDHQPGPGITEGAIALITAHLADAGEDVVAAVLSDVDSDAMAVHLAWLAAHMIRTTTGGQQWLQRYGLETAAQRDA